MKFIVLFFVVIGQIAWILPGIFSFVWESLINDAPDFSWRAEFADTALAPLSWWLQKYKNIVIC
jgi:hypothetical protein